MATVVWYDIILFDIVIKAFVTINILFLSGRDQLQFTWMIKCRKCYILL